MDQENSLVLVLGQPSYDSSNYTSLLSELFNWDRIVYFAYMLCIQAVSSAVGLIFVYKWTSKKFIRPLKGLQK